MLEEKKGEKGGGCTDAESDEDDDRVQGEFGVC
jgi:hypothetical protein